MKSPAKSKWLILKLAMLVGAIGIGLVIVSAMSDNKPAESTGRAIMNDGFFEIPELGIRLKISDELSDLRYEPDSSSTDSLKGVSLSSLYLINRTRYKPATGCNLRGYGLGSIFATTVGPVAVPHLAKNINGVTVVYAYPQVPCSTDETVKTKQASQVEALKKAFETAEPL